VIAVLGTQAVAKERRLWSQIKKWQKRLRLQEWEVAWEAVADGVIGEGLGADLQIRNPEYRRAVIRVSDWRELKGMDFHARHEMLHLALNDLRDRAMELAQRLGTEAAEREMALLAKLEEVAVTRLQRAFDEFEPIKDGEDQFY